jgi:Calx-beta domain-containing protein
VTFDDGTRISRVRIITGITPLYPAGAESPPSSDKVVLDNFVYGEPGQPVVSISDAPDVTEGDDGTIDATFTVTRSGDTQTVFTLPYATLGDGAAEGVDFAGKTGTLGFNAGVTTRQITVPVIGDKVDEVDEAFRVMLLDNGQSTIADGDGRALIIDNDPTVVVTATPTPTPTASATPTPTGYDPSKDTTPPKVTVTGYPKGKKCAKRDFTLTVKVVEDGLSRLRVKLDKTTLSDRAWTSVVTERYKTRVPAKTLKKGKHTFRILARDRGGNSDTRTIRFRRC